MVVSRTWVTRSSRTGWLRFFYLSKFIFGPHQLFSTFFVHGPTFTKNMRWTTLLCWLKLQTQEPKNDLTTYCTIIVTLSRKVMSRIYGTLCGLLGIPGGPLVVHLDHIENHWFTQNLRELTLSLKNSRFRILQSSVAGKSPAKMCFPTKQSQQQPHRCYFAEERIFS